MCMADGMTYALIFLVVVMFKRFGLNNATITFNIAWVCIPWIVRPICHLLARRAPLNKGRWMLMCEAIFAGAVLAMAATLKSDYWFQWSMLMLLAASTAGMVHGVMCESLYKDLTHNEWNVALRPLYVVYHTLAPLIGLGMMTMMAGNIEVMTRNTDAAWTATLRLMAATSAAVLIANALLAKLCSSHLSTTDKINNAKNWHEMVSAIRLFLGHHTFSVGALFMFCFLLPQGFTLGVSSLFLIDSIHRGGLGLSPQEYGLTEGTVGVLGLAVGCLLCMRAIKLFKFKNILLPLAMANFLPAISMVMLSRTMPQDLNLVNFWLFVGHAGLGIALTTALAFLSHYSCGQYKATYYSAGLALIALSILLSVLYSGTLQRYYGYRQYFYIALAVCALSPIVALVLRCTCLRGETPKAQ